MAMLQEMTKPKFDYQPQSLAGKSVVVTGGTTGIGRATALRLASEGARLLIFGRHERELKDALDDIQSAGEVHGLTPTKRVMRTCSGFSKKPTNGSEEWTF